MTWLQIGFFLVQTRESRFHFFKPSSAPQGPHCNPLCIKPVRRQKVHFEENFAASTLDSVIEKGEVFQLPGDIRSKLPREEPPAPIPAGCAGLIHPV